jgi:hypothetical protein
VNDGNEIRLYKSIQQQWLSAAPTRQGAESSGERVSSAARVRTFGKIVGEQKDRPNPDDGTDEEDERSAQSLEATRRNDRPVAIESSGHRGAAGGLPRSASPRHASVDRRLETFGA